MSYNINRGKKMVTQGDHVMGYTNEVKRGSLSVDYVSMFGATDDKYNKNVDNGGDKMGFDDSIVEEIQDEIYENMTPVEKFLDDACDNRLSHWKLLEEFLDSKIEDLEFTLSVYGEIELEDSEGLFREQEQQKVLLKTMRSLKLEVDYYRGIINDKWETFTGFA